MIRLFPRSPAPLALLAATLLPAAIATAGQTAATDVARHYAQPYTSEVVEIELAAKGEPGHQTEHAVTLAAGAPLLYTWQSSAGPVYMDFHGHTAKPEEGAAIGYQQVISYRHDTVDQAHGMLVAPFAGQHGWYFRNDSDQPLTISLRISGFQGGDVPPQGD
ncbi:hypothetical protein [Alkalilimnicola sp. S0819]|uniref:hypothetical protein n=1 Tax=Alkalilimnicola sp. S0819 TaxID=2613922 RepID=UPI001869B28E|nr:hypothetical protein [Alkalilimnicola sp. S0819]